MSNFKPFLQNNCVNANTMTLWKSQHNIYSHYVWDSSAWQPELSQGCSYMQKYFLLWFSTKSKCSSTLKKPTSLDFLWSVCKSGYKVHPAVQVLNSHNYRFPALHYSDSSQFWPYDHSCISARAWTVHRHPSSEPYLIPPTLVFVWDPVIMLEIKKIQHQIM